MEEGASVREREALGHYERFFAGGIGMILLLVGIWLIVAPPSRRVALASCGDAPAGCVVSVDGDVTSVATALVALSAAAGLVALLGVRFTSVKAAGVELGSNYDRAAAGLPKAEPQPSVSEGGLREVTPTERIPPAEVPVTIQLAEGFGTELGVVPVAVTRLTMPMQSTDSHFLRDYQSARRHSQRSYFLSHVLGPAKSPGQKYSVAIRLLAHDDPDDDVRSAHFYFGRAWGGKVFNGLRGSDGRFGITTEAFGPFLVLCEVEFGSGDRIVLDHYCDFEMGSVLPA